MNRNVLIIANCHTGPLAQILAFNSLEVAVDGIALDNWFSDSDGVKAKLDGILAGADAIDHLFSFNVSEQFGALETGNLRNVFGKKLLTFTNIRFDGVHPDCTYFGPFGGRWPNFLSEYHSKIVVQSYAAGRSASDCLSLFNGKVYEKLGYYSVFEQSAFELRGRDKACDVQFADQFIDMIREEHALLTINHPTTVAFHELVKRLCSSADLPFLGHDRTIYPNPLVQSIIWPIFNEVAEALQLKYRTPQYFVRHPDGYIAQCCRSISLEDYVNGCYEFYEARLPRDAVVDTAEKMAFSGVFKAAVG